MKKLFLIAIVLVTLANTATAQEWTVGHNENNQWNCDSLDKIIADFAEAFYIIIDGKVSTVEEIFAVRAPGCEIEHPPVTGTAVMELTHDWTRNLSGDYLYKCELVLEMVKKHGDLELMRIGNEVFTFLHYHQNDVPLCVPRHVIVKQNGYLRECADSSCDWIWGILIGEVLEVVGIRDGWYEVAHNEKTAFVDSADVVPGPYDIIEPEEQFVLGLGTDCALASRIHGDEVMYIATVKAGPAQNDMDVHLYLPFDEEALEIDQVVNKRFTDNNSTYILQHHPSNVIYPTGIYTIEISIGGGTYRVGFNAQKKAVYVIHVACNLPDQDTG